MGAGNTPLRITPPAVAYTLLLLVVVVFNPAFGNQFINFDDPLYISRNPMVQSGFTRDSLRWAFTSFDCANWHPLTWLSHMLDARLFGSLPFGSHLMNVVYHAVAAALLFVLLRRLTGALWPAFFAAALFAVHPLRVESVAWAAERKDVLSACFWMLTLLAYLWYVRRPGPGRFTLALLLFALGLMAKPMLVTVPLVLLLLDGWPLGRASGIASGRARWGRLLAEKVPFAILAALSAVITFQAQTFGGAVVPLKSLAVGQRLANAIVALVVYLSKIFWPVNLSMFYARPSGGIGIAAGAAATVALILLSVAALVTVRRRPYLLAGWSWYLIVLLPVLGIVQVGYQPWADRYTYIPSIGIAVALVWLGTDATRGRRRARQLLVAAGLAAALALSVAAQRYIAVWRDGESLFQRALAAGGETYMMRFCLGGERVRAGKIDEAITDFTRGLAIFPLYPDGQFGMAVALDMRGDREKAAVHYRRALALNPGKAEVHLYYGSLLERTGDPAAAEEHFREALRLQPGYPPAWEGVCRVLSGSGMNFEPPWYPACRYEAGWLELLDKAERSNYFEKADRWPSWAVVDETGGIL